MWSLRPDSNRCERLCRPLPRHSATQTGLPRCSPRATVDAPRHFHRRAGTAARSVRAPGQVFANAPVLTINRPTIVGGATLVLARMVCGAIRTQTPRLQPVARAVYDLTRSAGLRFRCVRHQLAALSLITISARRRGHPPTKRKHCRRRYCNGNAVCRNRGGTAGSARRFSCARDPLLALEHPPLNAPRPPLAT